MTVSDLVAKMNEILINTEEVAYTHVYMKKKLINYYGSDRIISTDFGKTDVITHRKSADAILREFYSKSKNVDLELQKTQFMETAAGLLKFEIKQTLTDEKNTIQVQVS